VEATATLRRGVDWGSLAPLRLRARAIAAGVYAGAHRSARRGAVVVVVSDLLDLPEDAAERIAQLASRGRVVVGVQTLDPDEASFPWTGPLRLRAMEGGQLVETDGDEAREAYLAALSRAQGAWETALARRGARLVRCETSEDPVLVVRRIVERVR